MVAPRSSTPTSAKGDKVLVYIVPDRSLRHLVVESCSGHVDVSARPHCMVSLQLRVQRPTGCCLFEASRRRKLQSFPRFHTAHFLWRVSWLRQLVHGMARLRVKSSQLPKESNVLQPVRATWAATY